MFALVPHQSLATTMSKLSLSSSSMIAVDDKAFIWLRWRPSMIWQTRRQFWPLRQIRHKGTILVFISFRLVGIMLQLCRIRPVLWGIDDIRIRREVVPASVPEPLSYASRIVRRLWGLSRRCRCSWVRALHRWWRERIRGPRAIVVWRQMIRSFV